MKKVSINITWFNIAVGTLFLLLIFKFFYSLFAFDLPLGFDPGMYRYLFIKYANAWPPISIPELRPWAQEYPYGLFIFTSYLIKAGIPVDWFLGWIWNLFPIALLGVYSVIIAKRENRAIGVLILLMGLLSIAYFDGFAQMYWKTYLALLFLILSFHCLERGSLWLLPFGILTILTHSQTGLILGLSLLVWWLVRLPTDWKDPVFRKWTFIFALIGVLGVIWYIPIWERAFWSPFKSILLLRGADAPAGNFPDTIFYIKNGLVLFVLSILGWAFSLQSGRATCWHIAPFICAVFIVFRLVFYKRFYLQFDFFMLYFAALALYGLWNQYKKSFIRIFLIILLIGQALVSILYVLNKEPRMSVEELERFLSIPRFVEDNAHIIALENNAAVWLLGWLPDYHTGGPGLFDFPAWTYEEWEKFIYGTHQERLQLMRTLGEHPLYFMTSSLFYAHYGEFAEPFVADECFEKVEGTPLLKVVCRIY
ncbi:hypothetical protein KJ652_05615 [Patescibacteria group bacterium]|nr:hypothetical protein [Patescibacteria group bacterium]MBU1124039.1 hypothetical protein [Patescibacteria group bacterium]MBU1911250.1 hypothetical protein [Patescibacteria group bacterium]